MRNKMIVSGLLACGLLASTMALSAVAEEKAEKADKANLKEQATVSKSEAKKLALAEVKKRGLHHARIKEAELEKEKGLVIWFRLRTEGRKDCRHQPAYWKLSRQPCRSSILLRTGRRQDRVFENHPVRDIVLIPANVIFIRKQTNIPPS